MHDEIAYRAIHDQSPEAHWVGSWSKAYSLWDVSGRLFYYAKRHHMVALFDMEEQRKAASLMNAPLKTQTTDPRFLQRWGVVLSALKEQPE